MNEFPAIDELENVARNAKLNLMGNIWIDEEAFFVATSKLKKSLPEFITRQARHSAQQHGVPILDAIDSIEKFVENGALHLAGRVWVDEATFWDHTKLIRETFAVEMAKPRETVVAESTDPDEVLKNARAEAAAIIAAAKAEAERIRFGLN